MANSLSHLLLLLRPLGLLYSFFMRIRAFLFSSKTIRSYSIPVPIISVGNLTMGGSGKTPIVLFLVRFLQKHGYRPAVVSRGYGGKASAKYNVVSDGKKIFLDSVEAGDEPRLIAEKAYGVAVITGKKRKDPCQYAVDQLGCDIIVLDDGFQHLSVQRDLDLVVFNAATNLKLMHVLPAGILREPFSALKRANSLIVSGFENFDLHAQKVESCLKQKYPNKPLFHLSYEPSHYIDHNGNRIELDSLSKPIFAFCGIASPKRFLNTLQKLSLGIKGFSFLSDHQTYARETLLNIVQQAKKQGAEALITTEKDLVKIKTFETDIPLYALCMSIPPSPSFESFILEQLNDIKHTG